MMLRRDTQVFHLTVCAPWSQGALDSDHGFAVGYRILLFTWMLAWGPSCPGPQSGIAKFVQMMVIHGFFYGD